MAYLQKEKSHAEPAYEASKRMGSIWPAKTVGAIAQYDNALIHVFAPKGWEKE